MENAYFYEQNHHFNAMESYFLDVSHIEGTDLYCDSCSATEIRKEVEKMPLRAVHHIGNGNYHYISLFFLERIREPFELVLFDHHSDNQAGAFGDELLSCGSWVRAAKKNITLLESVHWIGDPDNKYGTDLKDSGLPVYISIDLDVLSKEHIETVWDQGTMTPEILEEKLKEITRARKILGADICGYTDTGHPVVRRLDSFFNEQA